MKRRFALVLAIAMLTGSMAWAQDVPEPDFQHFRFVDARDGLRRVQLGVVPTLSTEGLNTAGLFAGYADLFMDPRFHNPNMEGTFLFVGGEGLFGSPAGVFAAADAPVTAYDPEVLYDPARIHLGFARNFGDFYLGVYFGGSFVNAVGMSWEGNALSYPNPAAGHTSRDRITLWDTNLAVLLGTAGMGFRLDLGLSNGGVFNDPDNDRDYEGANFSFSRDNPVTTTSGRANTVTPSLALTWGADMGQLLPWARVGFQFANRIDAETSGPGGNTELALRADSALEVAGGARFLLSDTTAVGGELWFNRVALPRMSISRTGHPDFEQIGGLLQIWDDDDDWVEILDTDGWMGFGLMGYYLQTVDFGGAALAFRPNVSVGMVRTLNNRTLSHDLEHDEANVPTEWEEIGYSWLTVATGIDLGAMWQATQRITLLTGVTVQLFDWTNQAEVGSNTDYAGNVVQAEAERSWWTFRGVQVSDFNIGMTFTAAEAIVFGLGLNSFVNGLFGQANVDGPSVNFTVSAQF